jgi:hypothetical protein
LLQGAGNPKLPSSVAKEVLKILDTGWSRLLTVVPMSHPRRKGFTVVRDSKVLWKGHTACILHFVSPHNLSQLSTLPLQTVHTQMAHSVPKKLCGQ